MRGSAKQDSSLIGGEAPGIPTQGSIAWSSMKAKLGWLLGRRATGSSRTAQTDNVRPLYIGSVVLGAAVGLMCFFGMLGALDASGNLPPPPLTNSLCMDEKLRFLRDSPVTDVNLLVIGSSVAWRHIDSAELGRRIADARPLNGAFCGLHVNQTQFTAEWLLSHYRSAHDVVMIASPFDFENCRGNPTKVFDQHDADGYVYGERLRWTYYVRYFDPVSLVRNALSIAAKRSNRIPLDPLVFTRYGDGPLNTRESVVAPDYERVPRFDAACYHALHDLAMHLKADGREFVMVSTPLAPAWLAVHDPRGDLRRTLQAGIVTALADTSARYWDASSTLRLPDDAFTDAIHLRWSETGIFTDAVADQIRPSELNLARLRTH